MPPIPERHTDLNTYSFSVSVANPETNSPKDDYHGGPIITRLLW